MKLSVLLMGGWLSRRGKEHVGRLCPYRHKGLFVPIVHCPLQAGLQGMDVHQAGGGRKGGNKDEDSTSC